MSHVSRTRGMTVASFRQRKGGEPLIRKGVDMAKGSPNSFV